MPLKLKWLVAVHLTIGVASIAASSVPQKLQPIPLSWITNSISFSQTMLISFWFGMGTSRASWRWLGLLLGTVFLAFCSTIGFTSQYEEHGLEWPPEDFRYFFLSRGPIMMLVGGVFWLIHWSFAGLQYFSNPPSIPNERHQYSIFHLLLITSVVAVFLGFGRLLQPNEFGILAALGTLAFLFSFLAVPWATLGIGFVRWRIVIVLGVTLLPAIISGLTTNSKMQLPEWQLWLLSTLGMLSIAIMILSLLVVRSCGYRLVVEARGRNLPAAGTSGPAA